MTDIPHWTVEEVAVRLAGRDEHLIGSMRESLEDKLAQGKGIVLYTNLDFNHWSFGDCVALTYGTPEAQFEPDQFPDGPPKQCPDGLLRERTGGINWRYQAVGIIPQP